MFFDPTEQHPGARLLFLLACLVVVVAGLRLGAPILLPFSLALFLGILTLPIMIWLQRRRVPAPLAILLAVLVDVAVFGLLILLASQSLSELQDRLPSYNQRLREVVGNWVVSLEERNIPAGDFITTESINPGAVLDFIGATLQRVASLLTTTFLVLIILVFILAEASVFPRKFRTVLGREKGDVRRLVKITREIQEYLGIKTLVSLATGLLLGLWCWAMGLDFPILLGLLAFALNYVPTIGSMIASLPAIALSLITHSLSHALAVALGYVVVNFVFGNILEPNLLGRRLNLSTLVVILSLLFWGWVWGPVGALLAVPLTMIVKIWLENTQDFRWIALMLDKQPPSEMEPDGPAAVDGDVGI